MKFKKTKIAALTLAGALAITPLAGCELVTRDSTRDLVQVVAEVDITKSAAFEANGEFSAYKSVITPAEVLKRELVASFASYSASYSSSGADLNTEATYTSLLNSLVNRQIYVQYAFVYFLQNGADVEDGEGGLRHVTYSVEGFNSAVSSASPRDKEIAGMRYFLEESEAKRAEYDVKVTINSTLDSQEHEILERSHDHSHSDTATPSSRTTPTGVDTETEDYYDEAYKIYTGLGSGEGYSSNPSNCGSYEAQDDSTPASRKQAYKVFLARLNTYGLIGSGENTSDITSLSYFALERKSSYETALLGKLDDAFERAAEQEIMEDWIRGKFNDTLSEQKETFSASDATALENALDGVSDTNFVLSAPDGYGFVINILLPFSAAQSQELSDALADMNDTKGNTFQKRASLLQKLTATDQRGAWLDAEYGFKAGEGDEPYGEGREYLFFENNLKKSGQNGVAQYEELKNYIGNYAYNGSVYEKEEDGETKFVYSPNKIDIDGFLGELEGYLGTQGLSLSDKNTTENYYTQTDFYKEDGQVDYSKFLYFSAKVKELENFDANKIFLKGSAENKAMSVINELSFAYNTDTGGFNSYLGYSVTPNKTDYVSEFEYAAQLAVRMGAGSITVAPSVYGWHIMYCTLSYSQKDGQPFSFDWAEKDTEGTFSNLYYEAMKADNFSTYSQTVQQSIINGYNKDSVTIYKERFEDRYAA